MASGSGGRVSEAALTHEQIRAFETALRTAIEQSDLTEAEALVRAELERAPDPLIQELVDRPIDQLGIAGWDTIALDMHTARRNVPGEERDREWGAVLLGLVNRNNVAGLPISVAFTFDAEPHRIADHRPSYMTAEQFEVWKADVQQRTFVPAGARYRAYPSAGRPCLQGLEELRDVHNRPTVGLSADLRDAVFTAQSLAAAIVLLRFHELVEQYVDDPGLPRPLSVFAHVETAEWPMETNTIDYGTEATRLLRASTRSGMEPQR